ncbi:MAG TPA: cysteine hydrolase [Solirubrobacteraceae bacterium]|jgi:nicotinamidase-related amidase|nr:cysteine hydrolase [Solirubrobacteraceae bacterium]
MTDTAPAPLDPARTALLVMDYQQAIVGMIDDSDGLVARAAEAIDLVRERGGHVGYVRVAFTAADLQNIPATSRMGARIASGPEAFMDDSPTTQIDERVAPRDGDIIVRKTRVGAFSTTDLADQLAQRGVDTLILAGISTSGVVLSTVRDGSDRDYALYVLSDATADRDDAVHACLIEQVFPRQADVITVAELDGLLPAA